MPDVLWSDFVDSQGLFHHPVYGSRPAAEVVWLSLTDAITNIRQRRANQPDQPAEKDLALLEGAHVVLAMAQAGGLTVPQWAAVIKKDKVPQQLADLCCDADMQPDERVLAFEALASLLDRLGNDSITDTVGHRQNALTAVLQQQFEASALIAGGDLPCLLTLTADELLQCRAPNSSSDVSSSSSSSSDVSSSSSSSSGGGGSSGSGSDEPWAVHLLLAEYLQHVYFKLDRVWPAGKFTAEVAASAAVPVCELALAVVQFTPRLLEPQQQQSQAQGSRQQSQQQQQQQQSPPAYLRALLPLDKSMHAMHNALVARFMGRAAPVNQPLFSYALGLSDIELIQSPCYLPALGTLLVTYGYAALIEQHKTLPGLSSKSSSSSSNSAGAATDGSTPGAASSSASDTRHQAGSSTPAAAAAATAPSDSANASRPGGNSSSSAGANSRPGANGSSSRPGANSNSSSNSSNGAKAAAAAGSKQGLKGGFFNKGGSSNSSSGTGSPGSSTPAAGAGGSSSSSSTAAAAAGAGSSSASVQQARQPASQQQQQAGSSSSSSSQSTAQSQAANDLVETVGSASWLSSQLPCQEVQQAATQAYQRMLRQYARLPAAHQTLLQLLEFDPRVAVWMGHHRRETAGIGDLLGMISMVRNNVPFAANPEQRKLRSHEHDVRMQQQFRGLTLFSLYWAAHHPFTTRPCLDCCDNALMLARDVLQPWLLQSGAHQEQQQQQQQQQQGQGAVQQYSRHEVAQEALSCLPAVLTRLLAAMQLHLDSTGSGSSGGSNGVTRQSSSSSSSGTKSLDSTPDGMVMLCQLLGVLLGAAGAWVPWGLSTQKELENQLTVAAWAPHAAELTAQFEAFCRASVTAAGVPALSKDVSHGTYKLLLPQPAAREFGVSAIACACVSAVNYRNVPGPLLQAAVAAGPGSREQRKLLGLLCSLFKYDAAVQPPVRPQNTQEGELVVGMEGAPSDRWPVDKAAVVAECTKVLLFNAAKAAAAGAASAGSGAADSTTAAAAVASLPWLWLFGRCCIGWSCQQAGSLKWQPQVSATPPNSMQRAFHGLGTHRCILLHMHAAVDQWLAAGSVAAELTAAGYNLGPVIEQFATAAAALRAAWDAAAGEQEVTQFLTELRRLGTMLCSAAAVKTICNNPACLTVAGRSETRMVSGRSCMCAGCRIAHYCCRACQRLDWAQHKPVCKALVAAAARSSGDAAAAAAGT